MVARFEDEGKLVTKFLVYADGEVVGYSFLEAADPSMACFWGRFYANENYSKIKAVVCEYSDMVEAKDHVRAAEAYDKMQAHNLVVATDAGDELKPSGGVTLIDYSPYIDETAMEVSVLGLPDWERYFPKYESEFVE